MNGVLLNISALLFTIQFLMVTHLWTRCGPLLKAGSDLGGGANCIAFDIDRFDGSG